LLKESHEHAHGCGCDHRGHSHYLMSVYMHVMADASTSLLAVGALLSGKYLGWVWPDPIMGTVGAIVVVRCLYGELKKTAPILLDASVDEK